MSQAPATTAAATRPTETAAAQATRPAGAPGRGRAAAIIDRWGLPGLGLVSFLSSTLLPGFSEVGLGALMVAGKFRTLPLLLWATLPNWLGSVVTYATGLACNIDNWSGWFGVDTHELANVAHLAQDHGAWAGLLVWVPGIGDPLAVALGLFRTPWLATCLTMLLGKALRYLIIYIAVLYSIKAVNHVRGK